VDYAAWNSGQVAEVNFDDFKELLEADIAENEWDPNGLERVIE
jgi:hypothetical protein